ncbi:alcohol oxidase [Xylariales sp. PMI_506]|nr:alcohol oxidase [Xylariales sp. PMI_506]
MPRLLSLAIGLLLSPSVKGYPRLKEAWHHRRIEAANQAEEYDYIIIGGGQAGLVVASRLSEEPQSTVLVVEYGYFDNRPEQLDPASAHTYPPQDLYNLTSVPQAGLRNTTQVVYSACVVGGGSTINGMMLNRGAAEDYDNWGRLNNDSDWSFEGLLPYFIKSSLFQEPSPALASDFNITWDDQFYGEGPIHLSIGPFQYPGLSYQWQGMEEVGCVAQVEGGGGNAYGVFWYPNAVDNTTVTRSYAVNQYYEPVANRTNLHLLTGYRANEITFDDSLRATGVRIQPRGVADGEEVKLIKARKEVVLSAGSLHSPQVLQRSGIGPSSLLNAAGIEVLVDLPGVGGNLQDHPVGHMSFNYTQDLNPNPTYLTNNSTFIDWAQTVWAENRTGPLSVSTGNTAALVPLQQVSPDQWEDIADALLDQNVQDFLPATYTSEQLAGFEAQRQLVSSSMMRDNNAVVEVPFYGAAGFAVVLTKQSSRGTVLLDPGNVYAEPTLDYHTFNNPVDVRIMIENYRFVRRWHQSPIMAATFAPAETFPGANITSDADLEAVVRSSTASSTAHISGTCAMTPQQLGGVVGTDLRVHGVTGLSVADASIIPLIPGAHTCATVYAIAEKAADLIKARNA